MKSIIFFVVMFSVCLAQQNENAPAPQRSSQTSQGHIQYSDPDGLKVSWKLYAPYSQWKTYLENPHRNQRAQSRIAHPSHESQYEFLKPELAIKEKQNQPLQHIQVHYKPYSMIPTHIKQLILEMYEPQGPYIDPSVYIYQAFDHQQEETEKIPIDQEETTQTNSQLQLNTAHELFEHIPKYSPKYSITKNKAGFIQYKNEPTHVVSAIPQYGIVPERNESIDKEDQHEQQHQQQSQEYQPQILQHYQQEQLQQYQQQEQQDYQQNQQMQEQQQNSENGMPKELHQLLNLQAQTPYHVIANRILYKPKTIFVPKPIPEDIKGPYKYRSKIYFIKNDQKKKDQSDLEEKIEQQ